MQTIDNYKLGPDASCGDEDQHFQNKNQNYSSGQT